MPRIARAEEPVLPLRW